MRVPNKQKMIVFQAKDGAIELRGDFQHETVWATQTQIAELFDIDRTVATKHIKNILKDKELDIKAVCANFAHTAGDGKTYKVQYYSLDVILSVGYRTNSKKAIEFRKWANKTLKQYLIQGSVLNKKVILKNYDRFMESVSAIQELLPENIMVDPKNVLDLVKEYAVTWSKLDAYDREVLNAKGVSKQKIKFTSEELMNAISTLRSELIEKGEATDIFANMRHAGSVEGIVGNVMQSFAGQDVYRTLEEKAAHLLYFLIKDHPFLDGNKRSAAFSFIWFLRKNKIKGARAINPSALTALALLIAESNPNYKEKMVALVVELLKIK